MGVYVALICLPAVVMGLAGALMAVRPDVVYAGIHHWYGLFGFDFERLVQSKPRVLLTLRLAGVLLCVMAALLVVGVVVVFRMMPALPIQA